MRYIRIAAEATQIGLVSQCVPDDRLMNTALDLADRARKERRKPVFLD